ncbi:MAG: bifunctional diguanylate cyclase/phosphodiesterase [Acidimicrobiales bacterium]|nr:bifunctional diguanylate cyclase/phosphodiesterase [Acidimicrobiales bacterium]
MTMPTTTTERKRGAPRPDVLVAGGVAALVLTILQLRWPVGPVADGAYLSVVVASAVVGVRVARNRMVERSAWLLIASGIALSALGDVVFYLLSWAGQVPDGLSWCDPIWTAGSLVLLAGILRLLTGGAGSMDLDGLIDAASLTVIVGFCAWPILVQPILEDNSIDDATRFVTALYPLLDVVMLALISRVVLGRRRSVPSQLLGLGLTGWLVADLASTAAFKVGSDGYGPWMNAGWMLSGAVMAIAICLPPQPDCPGTDAEEFLETAQIGSAIFPLLVPALLYAVGEPWGVAPGPWALVGVMAVLTILVLFRFRRLVKDRSAAARELEHQARHDPLTGLGNRTLFREELEEALLRDDRVGREPAVLYLDVDGFKKVNDSFGHEAGDAVLVALSERIRRVVGSAGIVARLGGDEFAVLVDGSASSRADAAAIAERLLGALAEPVRAGDREIALSGSVGIDFGGPDADASSLLRNADIAMYRAKATGKARWVVFEPAMRTVALERIELEADLGGAIERDELHLVYQPLVDLEDGAVVGFESLLRWVHPKYGTLAPDVFVPIAEETGQINSIGRWVLDTACGAAARWHERFGRDDLFVSVNVSGRQVVEPRFAAEVGEVLGRSGLSPRDLVLEVTETAIVADESLAAGRLDELRALGVRIAIDDFGTGYSSLAYLREFNVDILKIDQSFVRGISDEVKLPKLVRGLLDLGRTLDVDVVAEGIEREEQRDRLRDAGCRIGQGFLFAHGLDEDDATALLAHAGRSKPFGGGHDTDVSPLAIS